MTLLARNTYYSCITIGLRFLVNSVLFMLIARSMGPSEFGKLTFAISFTAIVLVFVDYGFNLKLMREISVYADSPARTLERLMPAKHALSLISTFVLTAIVVIADYDNSVKCSILILWLSSLCYSYGLLFNSVFKGLNMFQIETYSTAALNISLFFVVLIMLYFRLGIFAVAFAFLFARGIYLILSAHYIRNKYGRIRYKLTSVRIKSGLVESLPFGIHAIIAALYFQIDTVILSHYSDPSSVGYYQAAMRIITALMLINEVLVSAFFPVISSTRNSARDKYQYSCFRLNDLLFIGGALLFAMVTVLADKLILLLYGTAYTDSIVLLKLLAIVAMLRFFGSGYATIITASDKQSIRAMSVVCCLVVNVCLNLLLIPSYGAKGAAVAAIATNALIFSMYTYFSYKINHCFFTTLKVVATVVGLIASIWVYNYSIILFVVFIALICLSHIAETIPRVVKSKLGYR